VASKPTVSKYEIARMTGILDYQPTTTLKRLHKAFLICILGSGIGRRRSAVEAFSLRLISPKTLPNGVRSALPLSVPVVRVTMVEIGFYRVDVV